MSCSLHRCAHGHALSISTLANPEHTCDGPYAEGYTCDVCGAPGAAQRHDSRFGGPKPRWVCSVSPQSCTTDVCFSCRAPTAADLRAADLRGSPPPETGQHGPRRAYQNVNHHPEYAAGMPVLTSPHPDASHACNPIRPGETKVSNSVLTLELLTRSQSWIKVRWLAWEDGTFSQMDGPSDGPTWWAKVAEHHSSCYTAQGTPVRNSSFILDRALPVPLPHPARTVMHRVFWATTRAMSC